MPTCKPRAPASNCGKSCQANGTSQHTLHCYDVGIQPRSDADPEHSRLAQHREKNMAWRCAATTEDCADEHVCTGMQEHMLKGSRRSVVTDVSGIEDMGHPQAAQQVQRRSARQHNRVQARGTSALRSECRTDKPTEVNGINGRASVALRTWVTPRRRSRCSEAASTAPDRYRRSSRRVGGAAVAAPCSTRRQPSMCSSRTCTLKRQLIRELLLVHPTVSQSLITGDKAWPIPRSQSPAAPAGSPACDPAAPAHSQRDLLASYSYWMKPKLILTCSQQGVGGAAAAAPCRTSR